MGIKIKEMPSHIVEAKINKIGTHCITVGTQISKWVHTILHSVQGNKKTGCQHTWSKPK